MTPYALFYLFDCLLLVRALTQWSDRPLVGIGRNLALALLELILLIPVLSSFPAALLILLTLVLYRLTVALTEGRTENLFRARLIQLALLILGASTLFGIAPGEIRFIPGLSALLEGLLGANLLTRNVRVPTLGKLLVYLFGLLLTVVETNHAIRAVLKSINASPVRDRASVASGEGKEDTVELKRGKIIGAIERTLFFFFVLTGNYTSIGFILAAKGITRFKELDDKEFAEYFLIGTLLSSSLSLFCGELIKRLIVTF